MKYKVNTHFLLTLFLFGFILNVSAIGIKHPKTESLIKFTENKNQWTKNILYRAQLDGGILFLEKNSFTYNFYDKETFRKNHVNAKTPAKSIKSHAFRMTFLNAETAEIYSEQMTPDYCNFYIGKDKSKWAGNVKNYKEVNYKDLYDGIGLQILGYENSVKYNFIVSPRGNVDDIKLFYEGLENITLEKGSLRLKTCVNEITEEKPYAYQVIKNKKIEVPCEFVLDKTTVSFYFPQGYNEEYELIIDPVLVFACSSGSTADNYGMTATYDSGGNLYGGGTCFDQGYPTTLGAFDETYNGIVQTGMTDVVITKFDASGTFLQYSTYIGGITGTEVVSSLVVNDQDELMLFGATGSVDFPVTTGAFDTSFGGGSSLSFLQNGTIYNNGTDIYIAKFNSLGTNLLACTYIGGTENDGVNNSSGLTYNYGDYYRGEIQLDATGNCYIASCTYSQDFPVTAGCAQPAFGGGSMDGVVFKMPPNLSSMIWCTYLGSNADEGCYALTLDNSLNIYTTGGTTGSNFPTTAGVLDVSFNGDTDGFITKINSTGSTFLRSTFIGTGSYDQSFFIQLDNNSDVYIVGQTEGTMPVSAGVYSNSNSQQFIWKLNNDLNTQLFTTIFGNGNGQVNISPSAFLVDNCKNIYVCGWGGRILPPITTTTNMPLTSNAFQSSTDGHNFYLFVLAPNASSLLYATYFGGGQSEEHVDGGTSRFDKKGIVYQAVCSGCDGNDDFPVTPGSWPNLGSNVNQSTNCNLGVFKFDFQTAGVDAMAVISPGNTVCLGAPINFNNTSSNALSYLWNFGDGFSSTLTSPSHTYAAPGTYSVTLIAFDPGGCIASDTTNLTVNILPEPTVYLGNDTVLCQTPNLLLDAGTSGNIYSWSTGATTQTITATSMGQYWVTVSNGVCSNTDTMQIQQFFPPSLGTDTSLCAGQNLTLHTSLIGGSYQWSTGETTPTINVSSSGQYWVLYNTGICQGRDTIDVVFIPVPASNLPPTEDICPGASVTLDAGNPSCSYLWSTGEATQTINVDSAGTYVVTVSNNECSIMDTTVVSIIPLISWEESYTLCNAEKYTLDAGVAGAVYQWSNGATTQSVEVIDAGIYWVVMNVDGCILSDTISVQGSLGGGILWFPNSFTPNKDGRNDNFIPKGEDITEFHLMIFNRWGELLFETQKPDQGWDGTHKGKPSPLDVYVWKVKYKTKCSHDVLNERIGHVTLVR